ncbi:NUC153 domain-containing protein [Besnoitia besnoiti]|uniref:NUC153 domain-containing protein n=1 Tax=Besnoitia besnoiti TaxID=94643 RepID=A0A2A9MJA7_BESBE|nr:NUC153 domain-containing protein [Besnoitia besnoiti]PFH37274.1 NUC153 domain-containing protein [Besnoitia besnoiti]
MERAPAAAGAASSASSREKKLKKGKEISKKGAGMHAAGLSAAGRSEISKKKQDPRFRAQADRRFLLEKLLPTPRQKGAAPASKKASELHLLREKQLKKKFAKQVLETDCTSGDDAQEEGAQTTPNGATAAGKKNGQKDFSVRASLADSWENDERFSRIFTDDAFAAGGAIGAVDKFGRALNKRKEKDKVEKNAKTKRAQAAVEAEKPARAPKKQARELDEDEVSEEAPEEKQSDEKEEQSLESGQEEEEDEDDRGSESSESEEVEEEGPSVWGHDDEDLLMGEEASTRLAVMGLEWENITANDLLLLFRSFARDLVAGASCGAAKREKGKGDGEAGASRGAPETIVKKVSIYPSDFGLERMKIEAVKGPCIDWASVEGGRRRESAADATAEEAGEQASASEDEGEAEPTEEEEENEEGDEEDEDEEEKVRDAREDASDAEACAEGKRESGGEGEEAEEIDASSGDEDNDGDMKPTEEEERLYNEALRKYQKERSRYFYAVVEFDSVASAKYFYDELDGCDIAFALDGLDLRFIPDDLEFPHPPTSVSWLGFSGSKGEQRAAEEAALLRYEPPPAVSTALRHSRVKCTWDETPIERTKLLKRRFTEKELRDLDLQEYLASSSSSEDEEEGHAEGEDARKAGRWKLTEANLQEYRRQLLGDAADLSTDDEEDSVSEGDMSRMPSGAQSSNVKISFEGELENLGVSSEDEADEEKTDGFTGGDAKAWEAYVQRRKKKEKEHRKREARKFEAARAAAEEEGEGEENEEGAGSRRTSRAQQDRQRERRGKNTKFPLFAEGSQSDDASGSDAEEEEHAAERPVSRALKRDRNSRAQEPARGAARRNLKKGGGGAAAPNSTKEASTAAELELLTLGHEEEGRRHFDLRDELLSRKSKRKAKQLKRMREEEKSHEQGDAFKIDVDDSRFSRLFSNPDFAIDPTNPNFKASQAISRRKHRLACAGAPTPYVFLSSEEPSGWASDDLSLSLVAVCVQKTAATDELLRVKRARSAKPQFSAPERSKPFLAETGGSQTRGTKPYRSGGDRRFADQKQRIADGISTAGAAADGKVANKPQEGFALFAKR